MIVVIADDFTGAAEVAAIAMCHGLKTEIQTEFNTNTDAELLVIDTDTRSCKPHRAAEIITQTIDQIHTIEPDWIYKKIDSVLRGPVLCELEAMLAGTDADRILLIPANPSFARTIKAGTYLIDGIPLNKTDFANDPEYPAKSANVLDLLGKSNSVNIESLNTPQPIPTKTIVVGDAQSRDDLIAWSSYINKETIPVGAADFFEAILDSKGFNEKKQIPCEQERSRGKSLFVCTSGSEYSRNAVKMAETNSIAVIKMPEELFNSETPTELVQQWADATISVLLNTRCAVITIGQSSIHGPEMSMKLRQYTADTVGHILNAVNLDELYIEGGATASTIVKKIGLKRFIPVEKLAPGVVKMSSPGIKNMHITIKPGSYPWPDNLWHMNK